MSEYIFIIINAAVLIYGGVTDFKKREIPNIVPVVLIVDGIFLKHSLLQSIIGLVAPAVLLFVVSKITKSEIPGGDFKLLCSLGFVCGLPGLAAIILLAGIESLAYGLVKQLPLKRHIPLCSYIAPVYITFQAFAFLLGGERVR
jgi:Flp pilus assembly protein protease CpaA